jgi:hypothetical protein
MDCIMWLERREGEELRPKGGCIFVERAYIPAVHVRNHIDFCFCLSNLLL